jgi:hypothetical protein
MKFLNLYIFLLFIFSESIRAQDIRELQIPVEVAGKSLQQPWVGGLNAPQFSKADLNHDGISDLFIYDRIGRKALGFMDTGKEGAEQYQYKEELTSLFPVVKDWVLLKDFNGDGVPDIFTASGNTVNGIRAFRGKWQDNKLAFDALSWADQSELTRDLFIVRKRITPDSLAKEVFQLYSFNIDIPGIYDIDGDGDLDIITFNDGGFVATFYKNYSIEQGHGLDSLLFVRDQSCWGKFYESGVSIRIDLSDDPNMCFSPLHDNPDHIDGESGEGSRHAGSTLTVDDFTGNGLPDLLLGDVSFAGMVLLENHGTLASAWMTKQDTSFPGYNVPINLPYFPAAYLLDIDGDGLKDIMAAPNDNFNGRDTENAWFYKNTGSANQPVYTFQQEDYLAEDMIDVGTKSAPAFLDYNGDGLQDLVIAAGEKFRPDEFYTSRLYLFENVGTATQPAFKLVDEDFLDFSQYADVGGGTFDFVPHFADMDGDGDMDLFVGDYHGKLFYAENITGEGQPVEFGPVQYPYANISIGRRASPFVADLNNDGLPDLLIGEDAGNINYFENVGSAGQPSFIAPVLSAPNIERFGNIITRGAFETSGASSPVIMYLRGVKYVLSGSANGSIMLYELDSEQLSDTFPAADHAVRNLYFGRDAKCAFTDLNEDGFLEMVCGNKRGGLNLRATEFRFDSLIISKTSATQFPLTDFLLAPNPVSDQLKISWENDQISHVSLRVFHISGAQVKFQRYVSNGSVLDTSSLPAGSYIVRLEGDGWNRSYPVVK